MAETLLALLTAHLLGDFVLQTQWIIQHKKRLGVLLLHVSAVTALSGLFLGSLSPTILGTIFVTHLVMDAVKALFLEDTLLSFLIDQATHLTIIVLLAIAFPHAATDGWWPMTWPWSYVPGLNIRYYYAALCVVSWTVASLPLGEILIAKALTSRDVKGPQATAGLAHGGATIGWLERALIMMMMAMNQPAGIGFLITTKSIFRFAEITTDTEHKVAEYMIIGTFMSFAWGLFTSILALNALHYWIS